MNTSPRLKHALSVAAAALIAAGATYALMTSTSPQAENSARCPLLANLSSVQEIVLEYLKQDENLQKFAEKEMVACDHIAYYEVRRNFHRMELGITPVILVEKQTNKIIYVYIEQ